MSVSNFSRSSVSVFFTVSACSWMPHWACHYYRLETHSTFAVGDWSFSRSASVMAIAVYTLVILMNVLAVVSQPFRVSVAMSSGVLHLMFASLHAYRLIHPFRFDVLGYNWPLSASFHEVLIVGVFGLLSILVGMAIAIGPPTA